MVKPNIFNLFIKVSILSWIILVTYPVLNSFAQTTNRAETTNSAQTNGASSIDINDDIRKFCGNIVDVARDKRYLLQREELHKLQSEVDERIEKLKIYRNDYKKWLDKRNEFLATAEASLVEIFKKMKPDAAAKQLEIVDKNIAAAIIMKLSPRLSSQIFNEMNAETAALLATIIASAANRRLDGQQS